MVAFLYSALIDAEAAEAAEVIGVAPHEPSLARTTRRTGTRPKLVTMKAADVALKIAKLRKESVFPSVLERRRRIHQALSADIMEAHVQRVSTRKVDPLFQTLGADAGISKSEVLRICGGLDADVETFRTRDLAHLAFSYLFADATSVKARVNGHVISRAVVVVTVVSANGGREVLATSVGDSQDEAFFTEVFQSLRSRSLHRVPLAASDDHGGLRAAISRYFVGAAWQRCRVHFIGNVLVRAQRQRVTALIRTVFARRGEDSVSQQSFDVEEMLSAEFSDATSILAGTTEALLACSLFPREHWTKVWSSNSIERLNREIKRRTRVVAIFLNDAAVLRIITAVEST